MSAVIFLTTAPNGRSGRRIASALVRERLAACVNVIDGARSFYRWKGRLENSAESLLIIKTVKQKFDRIEKFLKTAHPYELPELIGLPVRWGSKGYLQWLARSVV